ncbi:TetR/AcrR family transcriptional regulator [Nocardia transvalensis]|uniref:TetR/AcrR family transcriptional regulator n=1 Tax=Nocardia transvalensis TaxID=37333 RepID=UPI001894D101|nr:TetR/AcrR family transcriptional regulator [Nocardia transvalensis]MBF6331318.1 TetR/AcrR family transcriptional regulator [Nocardia transvalensis]
MPVNTRSDAQRSRMLLVDAVGSLLHAGRVGFSVPELATEAGVGVATAYRHFPTPQDAMQAFHRRAVEQLLAAFAAVDPGLDPVERFHRCCRTWVEEAMQWGSAVRFIRSSKGFIERLSVGDPIITALHDTLGAVLTALTRVGRAPESDTTYAVLMWTTIFDERVVYDLTEHRHWSPAETTEHLTRAVAGALGISV